MPVLFPFFFHVSVFHVFDVGVVMVESDEGDCVELMMKMLLLIGG